jgi:1,4-dihydroxy-2-naphthoate octaprenyltransferase
VKTRYLFASLIAVAGIVIIVTSFVASPFALFGLVGVIAVKPALDAVARGAKGRDLIIVLGAVGKAQMIMGLTYAAGIAIALI